MIDPATRDAALANLAPLRKRNDRTVPSIAGYIEALEKELASHKEQLVEAGKAHQKVLEYFTDKKAAQKATTELLPSIPAAGGSQGVMEVIAAAEAKAVAAAAKPFWKFW